MKVVKLALLGTAALAAVSVSARAEDLSALKAQIEALNGRISQLEAAPAVPAGYQLLTVSETDAIIVPGAFEKGSSNLRDYGTKATNIGIMPTADVPASTNIQWSGYVKAGVVYTETDFDSSTLADRDAIDVVAKAGIKVVGTTDTAVGEVGVSFAVVTSDSVTFSSANHNGHGSDGLLSDGFWGWWKITPEMTLAGGVDGSLAGNGQGFDGREGLHLFGDGSGGYNHNGTDPAQIRLSYASGPISFAIALEDGNNTGSKSALGVAGEVKWSGDAVGFEVNAGYWDNAIANRDSNWTINAGANIGLGDIATLSIAGGVGEDSNLNGNLDRYSKLSAHIGFNLSDAVSAELGASHKWVKGNGDITSIGAGIFYTPVSQLTLGLEASYTDTKGSNEKFGIGVISVYRF
jgi:hypothetical protein